MKSLGIVDDKKKPTESNKLKQMHTFHPYTRLTNIAYDDCPLFDPPKPKNTWYFIPISTIIFLSVFLATIVITLTILNITKPDIAYENIQNIQEENGTTDHPLR